MPKSSHSRSPCPVVFALDLFGDRWSLVIIRDMAMMGRSSFGEFLEAGEGISTNILADRLRRLEQAEVITKERDPEHGAKFRYRLTEKGLDLIPVLLEMVRWGGHHDPDTPVPKAMLRRLDREPREMAEEFRARVKGES